MSTQFGARGNANGQQTTHFSIPDDESPCKPFCHEKVLSLTLDRLQNFCDRLKRAFEDPRAGVFLIQRLSLDTQRDDAISVIATIVELDEREDLALDDGRTLRRGLARPPPKGYTREQML